MKARSILELEAKNKAWSHAYLFIGGSETEKAEICQFISSENNVPAENLIEIRPEEGSGKAGEIKVDQIREVLHQISLSTDSKRIICIYSAEKLNQSSGNILLKNLEEPVSPVIFLLFAGKDSVLPTIRSRCRQYFLSLDKKREAGTEYIARMTGFPEASSQIEEIVKKGETEDLLSELESFFQNKLEKQTDHAAAAALEEIFRTRREISGNANPRLALEALYLKVKEGLIK